MDTRTTNAASAQPTMAEDARGDRRAFLRAAGLGGTALALAACRQDGIDPVAPDALLAHQDDQGSVVLDFKDDFGVLNYAYALEQLEAAFYIMVLAQPYGGMTTQESRVLTDVRDHEIAHRDFFRAALGGNAIGNLAPDFSTVNFSSRTSVLKTARTFEDLGVAAYNGAARYLVSATYLTIAGKIVSVEARHASAIRSLIAPRRDAFAPRAFDDAFEPATVIATAHPFIKNRIELVNVAKTNSGGMNS